jgi:hypothetical protein
MITETELRSEIATVTASIKAFKIGCPWLAPDGYDEAPGVIWLQAQQRGLLRQLEKLRALSANAIEVTV